MGAPTAEPVTKGTDMMENAQTEISTHDKAT
jgi:hypothetical protein